MSDFLLPGEETRMKTASFAPAVEPPTNFLLPGEQTAAERAASTLRTAIPNNPDQVAERRRLSNATGVPEDVVSRNVDTVKTEAQLKEIRQAMAMSPILARQLTDPNFAALAHDDVWNLAGISDAVKAQFDPHMGAGTIGGPAFQRQGVAKPSKGPEATIGSYFTGLLSALSQGGEATRQGIRMQFADAMGFESMSKDAAAKASRNRFDQRLTTPEFESDTARAVYGGLSSVVNQAPGIALSIATGNPTPSLAAIGVQTEAEAYTKYRARGATPTMAALGAMGEGATEVLTEKFAMSFLVNKLGKAGAGEFLAGLLIRDIPGEQIATLVQDAIDTAVANPNKTWGQYAAERKGAAYQTLVATITQTGVMAGANSAIKRMGDYRPEMAEQHAGAIEQLIKLSTASKVRERDPTSFQTFVNAAAEDGPVANIHVSAATFLQAAGEKIGAIAEAMPSVKEQLAEAQARGGELVIPLGEFAANVAGTGMESALIDHIRTAPDAMTRAEAKEFMQSGQKEIEAHVAKILEEKEFDTAFKESGASVERELLAQLKQANRFTDDVNTPYAKLASAFYTVQAARLGITPEEMYVRYPLQISAEGLGGANAMDQARRARTETPEFKAWFGDSKVADDQGKPRVMYHGTAGALGDVKGKLLWVTPSKELAQTLNGGRRKAEALFVKAENIFDPSNEAHVASVAGELDNLYRSGTFSNWRERINGHWKVWDDSRARSAVEKAGFDAIRSEEDGIETLALIGEVADRVKSATLQNSKADYNQDGGQDNGRNNRSDGTAGQSEELHATVAGGRAAPGWADATRIRGNDGKPATLYRGAARPLSAEDFGHDSLGVASGNPSSGLGVFFTVSKGEASTYGATEGFHLDLRNPFVVKIENLPGFDSVADAVVWREKLRTAGHDGIIISAKHIGGKVHAVAFEPEQVIKPKNELNQSGVDQTETPEFKAWSNDAPVFPADEIEGYGGGPAVFELYHGTASDFTEFARERANPESDLGAGFYFTNTREDVSANYAGEGPDLTQRIQLLAERIASETDREYDDPEVITEAKQQLAVEHGGMAMPVFVKVENPVIIGGENETQLIYEQEYDEQNDEYGEEQGTLVDFLVALRDAASHYDDGGGQGAEDAISALIAGGLDAGSLRASEIVEILKNDEQFGYLTDDNGYLASHEIMRQAFEAAGFDGFVDYTVNEKFGSERRVGKQMAGMDWSTAHVVVFEPTQIKSAIGNDGSFDANDPSILSQGERGKISFGDDITKEASVISLLKNADLSTFVHELGHFQLEVLAHISGQPDAPAGIRADMDALLKWFGVPDLATWQGMSLDEKRPHHEQLARGFEAYLFEGKAPDIELQSVFSRVRAWMINVYKSIKPLNVELSDEVRGVFDRLIGTNEEILAAEAERGYAPLFKSAEEMGATQAEWQAYQEQNLEQTQAAVDELGSRSLRDMRWVTNTRAKVMKAMQKDANTKRRAVEAEVKAEVQQQPVYAVQHFLKTGEMVGPDGDLIKIEKGAKLDNAALAEMYPDTMLSRPDLTGLRGFTRTDGLHPDLVAQMFGFTSGDQLVRELLAAEPEASVVEGMTDQRMLERYGDLTDQDAISRAADAAVHNEARGRFIATELNALQKATGQARVLAKAAKSFAATIIARKKIRDVKPAQYSAAEARAGKAAEKAKDLVEKATEKRNQLVNHHATRAAYDALADVDKGLAYFKKLDGNQSIDIGYREQIDAMLERFDMRSGQSLKAIDKRTSLAEWIQAQEAIGYEPTISDELRNEAFRKSFKDMTVEEFRGLVDAIKNIEHLGRLKKKLLTAADQRDFDKAVADLTTTIQDNAKKTLPEQRASDRGFLVSVARVFRTAIAMHRKFASLARGFDGYKDGGVAWEYLVRNMNERGDFEAVENDKATTALAELLLPVMKGDKMTAKQYFPDIGKSFTREERIGIALNMGNEVNRERVASGEKLMPHQLDQILDTLTKTDWDFVQGVWDYLDTFRPQIAAKERRISGTEPDWVEASPIRTKHGEYAGGYFPIAYDPVRSERSNADVNAEVARQMQQGLYARAQTRRGHTKARTESTGRALRYDFAQVITSHVTQVVHDLAWHEYLIDANRLLRSGAVETAVRDHYGVEVLQEMKDTVRDIAVGSLGAEKGAKYWNHLRYGVTIAGLGFNVFNALQNMTSITQSMSRIGTKWVFKGAVHWAGDAARFEGSIKQINEKSDFMRMRSKTLQREVNDIRNKVSGKNSKLQASYFYLQQKTQLVVDVPTWWGAYEKAMGQDDMTEDKAVALADQAVIDAGGSGQVKDLAGIQRGGAGMKLFTTFYSYFNTTFNLTAEAAGRTDFKKPGEVALFAADLVLLYSLPALLSTLLKAALSGDLDDEEKLTKKIIADHVSFVMGTIVGLREATAGVQAALGVEQGPGYTGPASVRFFSDLYNLGKQINQGEADEAFWKALNNVGGMLFHYPAGQMNRIATGIAALSDGRTENPAAVVMGAPHK